MIEEFIDAAQEDMPGSNSLYAPPPAEMSGWEVATEVWDIIIWSEDDAKMCLKERHKTLKQREKRRKHKEAKSVGKKEHQWSGFRGRRQSWSSSNASSTGHTSSTCSDGQ